MRPVTSLSSASPAPAVSPWHSPVPYLFGGLAAMMGLIAFALLILACSYWKLNGNLAADSSVASSDGVDKSPASPAVDFADLVAVVMAGDKMPTFLAMAVDVADQSTTTELHHGR